MKKLLILVVLVLGVAVAARADYVMKTMQVLVINAVKVWDGTTTWVIDSMSSSGVTIEVEHHKVHDGKHYFATDYDEDMDIAAPTYWLFITPDDKYIHVFFELTTSASGVIELFENTTTTNNGTAVSIANNFRGKGDTTLKLFNTSTISADGNRLGVTFIGSGSGKKSVGGGASRSTEIILAPATYYAFKLTPTDDNTIGTLILEFYEVDV